MHAAWHDRLGGPEVLQVGECARPEPGQGQVLLRVSRAAVNFSDERSCRTGINHFTGMVETLPAIPGGEVVGRRCDTGERVAALCRTGGYARYVAVDETLVLPLPDRLDDDTALGVFVPGLTAALLLQAAGDPGPGCVAAVSGATGAVGSILLQLLRGQGVGTRIAVASGPEAEATARLHGATAVVDPAPPGLADALRTAGGGGVDVVFDSVGGSTTQAALDALNPCGRVLVFGGAGGGVAAIDPRSLIVGSRAVTGFWLMDHLADRDRALEVFERLLGMASNHDLVVAPARIFGLPRVAHAMRAAGTRGGRGRLMLDPWTT